MSSSINAAPTPERNAQDIAALTQAVNVLVAQFIRPNAQQTNANRETLDRVADLLERHATGLLTLEERLEDLSGIVSQTAQQQQANANQIAAIGDRLEQFDHRLEDTRAIVAENGSRIAQLSVKQDQLLDEQRERSESLDQKIDRLVEENGSRIAQLSTKQDQLLDEQRERSEALDHKIDRLVEENGSRIAQLSTKQDQFINEQRERSEKLSQNLNSLVEENRAFRESQQSQLAAIIGNARRIDRLEQQAS